MGDRLVNQLAQFQLACMIGRPEPAPGKIQAVTENPLPGATPAPAVVVGADVGVMMESVGLGPAGRSVRPSSEHATSVNSPKRARRATTARRVTANAR